MKYLINLGNNLDGAHSKICDSLEGCQKALDDCCAAQFNALSQRDCHKGFGNVKFNGKKIAQISWNGRIWNLDGTEYKSQVTA